MARPRQPPASSTRPRPLSADSVHISSAPEQSSMLFKILPSMVKCRLPCLVSLRRSASAYSLKAHSRARSVPGTPSDDYTAMVLSRPGGEGGGTDMARADYFGEEMGSSEEDEREKMTKELQKTVELTERKSGIGWKFASQGLSLLSISITESTTLSRHPNSKTASPSLARQLYIHALSYLLRGLPADLTIEEGLEIRNALSPKIASPLRVEIAGGERYLSYNSTERRKIQPSFLHRTLATSIINLFILIQFLLPYIKVLLRAAYDFERTHRISEKVLASSIETVDGLTKIGMRSGGVIWGSGFAVAFGEVVNWVVEGVSGGIQEGVGEGMARFGIGTGMELKSGDEL